MITPGTNVLGVGGGKVIDVAKLASYDKNVFLFQCQLLLHMTVLYLL